MCGCIGMWFYVICYSYMLYKTLKFFKMFKCINLDAIL